MSEGVGPCQSASPFCVTRQRHRAAGGGSDVAGEFGWHQESAILLDEITQEVRDFAAKQNQGADAFLAATPVTEADAEAGMAEMSKVFREKGGEIYLPAAE